MTDHALPSIKVRRRANGKDIPLPRYATSGAVGLDLCAAESVEIPVGEWRVVGTGLEIMLPSGHEAQIRPRSGLAANHGVTVLNAPGTIDPDYRGEVKVILINKGLVKFTVEPGDRIAQMVIGFVPRFPVEEVAEVSETERGSGGFGSTGR